MKVFNQGSRKFVYHELVLAPGQFTTVPEQHAAGIAKLLAMYPSELVSSETADSNASRMAKTNQDQATRISELTAELTKLRTDGANVDTQKLIAEQEATIAEQKKALADVTEERNLARDRILELEREAALNKAIVEGAQQELAKANAELVQARAKKR